MTERQAASRIKTGRHRWLSAIGRRLRPLFQPDYDTEVSRALEVAKDLKVLHKHVSGQRADLAAVDELLRRDLQTSRAHRELAEAQRTADVTGLRQGLAQIRHDLQRQAAAALHLLHRIDVSAEQEAREAWVRSRLERLAHDDGPILVGPWTGEVGFEILYWIPFLRWAVEKFRIDPARLVVMSRGGTAAWYHPFDARYLDALELLTPAAFRDGVLRDKPKQRMIRELDRRLVRGAKARLATKRVGLLHPSLMYHLLWPIWKRHVPATRLAEYTTFAKIDRIDEGLDLPPLPKDYVAVRFYFSQCFPDCPDNRRLVGRVLAGLTRHTDVVVLNPGIEIDDHHDYEPGTLRRLHVIDGFMTPERNLALQSAVISRSRGFVGTYGGFAYVAPFHGVNALAFYSTPTFFMHHLEVAQEAFETVGGGRLVVVDTAVGDLAAQALGTSA